MLNLLEVLIQKMQGVSTLDSFIQILPLFSRGFFTLKHSIDEYPIDNVVFNLINR